MRVSLTISGGPSVADREQDQREQRQRDALEQHAVLHDLVLLARIAAARHLDDAEPEHPQRGEHDEPEQDHEKGLHRLNIAPAAATSHPIAARLAEAESGWLWTAPRLGAMV